MTIKIGKKKELNKESIKICPTTNQPCNCESNGKECHCHENVLEK